MNLVERHRILAPLLADWVPEVGSKVVVVIGGPIGYGLHDHIEEGTVGRVVDTVSQWVAIGSGEREHRALCLFPITGDEPTHLWIAVKRLMPIEEDSYDTNT